MDVLNTDLVASLTPRTSAEHPYTPPPPEVRGRPLFGFALEMRENPLLSLVELYRQYGSIFRIRALNRRLTVLAGREANIFLMRKGGELLGSERLFSGTARELGTNTFLVALDGDPHRNLKKQMKRGYTRTAVEPHVGRFIDQVDEATRDWKPGDRVAVLPFFERLVTGQLGQSLNGRRPGEELDNIRLFLRTLLNVEVMKTWPRIALWNPSYLHAKKRVFAFVGDVLEEHRNRPTSAPKDLVDDVLSLTDEKGLPLTEEAIVAAAIGPYFGGLDTIASTLSFMTYGVLKHPEAMEAVQPDADRAMTSDNLFGEIESYEMLHALALETLRMWPVAPFTPQTARKPFVFDGHVVDEGEDILVAQTVTHYLEEFFQDPYRFDFTRPLAPRRPTRQFGVFAPFSPGVHTCLGTGAAEVQMMVTMAALLNRFELELEQPDEPVPVLATPIPNPGRRFSVRIKARR